MPGTVVSPLAASSTSSVRIVQLPVAYSWKAHAMSGPRFGIDLDCADFAAVLGGVYSYFICVGRQRDEDSCKQRAIPTEQASERPAVSARSRGGADGVKMRVPRPTLDGRSSA